MHIAYVQRVEIEIYVKECRRANLTFSSNTQYVGIRKEGKVIAFTGWNEYHNKLIFKNGYIPLEHRGNGYWKSMIWVKLQIALMKNKTVEATCTPYSLKYFLELGAEIIKEYKNNTTKVIFNHDNLLKAERMARRFATHQVSL